MVFGENPEPLSWRRWKTRGTRGTNLGPRCHRKGCSTLQPCASQARCAQSTRQDASRDHSSTLKSQRCKPATGHRHPLLQCEDFLPKGGRQRTCRLAPPSAAMTGRLQHLRFFEISLPSGSPCRTLRAFCGATGVNGEHKPGHLCFASRARRHLGFVHAATARFLCDA